MRHGVADGGFCFVAKTGTKSPLPLAVEASHADEAGVSEAIDNRTPPAVAAAG
jgi:hypothetical protein